MSNILLSKLTESELQEVTGEALKCSTTMPSYVKKKPNSSVYYAWVYANCTTVASCKPSTWNHCY